jgi:hypothetical protein
MMAAHNRECAYRYNKGDHKMAFHAGADIKLSKKSAKAEAPDLEDVAEVRDIALVDALLAQGLHTG